MRELSRCQLLEDISYISLSIIIKRVIECVGVENILREVIYKENLKRIIEDEYLKVKEIYKDPKTYAKSLSLAVKGQLVREGLIGNNGYSEIVDDFTLEASLCGFYDNQERIVKEIYLAEHIKEGDNAVEVCEGLYVVEKEADEDDSLRMIVEDMGLNIDIVYLNSDGEEVVEGEEDIDELVSFERIEIQNGSITYYQNELEKILEIINNTENQKVSKLAMLLINRLVSMDYAGDVIGVLSEEYYENIIINKYEEKELNPVEIVSTIIIGKVLIETIKKEGY